MAGLNKLMYQYLVFFYKSHCPVFPKVSLLVSFSSFCQKYFLSTVLPRVTPFYFEDNPLHSGQYVQVMCLVAEGDLPIDITWELNGRNIIDYQEISTSKVGKRSSTLAIESVSHLNAGNYSCKARNKAGESEYVTQLYVNGY